LKIKKHIYRVKLFFYIPKQDFKLNNTDQWNIIKRKERRSPLPFNQKALYMKSQEWQTMQKIWLYKKKYRCQMFPFLVLGQHKPKKGWWNDAYYGKYAIHHINTKAYKNLGLEELDRDVIVLSKFAHKWVYHYLLSFGKRKVSDQKLVKFANPLQKIMNYWCFLNKWMKLILALIIIDILS
jgi:hypothetical protein